MRLCGSFSMSSRSLHVPGSDSSALTTMYFGFHAGREAGAAAAAKIRSFHFVDDCVGGHGHGFHECFVAVVGQIRVDRSGVRDFEPARQNLDFQRTWFVVQHELLNLPVGASDVVDQLVEHFGRDVVVEIVSDLDRGRP
jgi:hypothetical protein